MTETTKISNPTNEQWFICWDNKRSKITVYGSVIPNQYMETPFIEIDTYESESEWEEILLENGINNEPVLIDSLL